MNPGSLKRVLSWPDNDCTVGRTNCWGILNPDDMRLILSIVPHASFTPTFHSDRDDIIRRAGGRPIDWHDPVFERLFDRAPMERIGHASMTADISFEFRDARGESRVMTVSRYYPQRGGFYVNNLTVEDVEKLRAVFDIGPRGAP